MSDSHLTISQRIFVLVPWVVLPLMLNIRIFPFVAPYEEPRWLLFVAFLCLSLLISAYHLWRGAWQYRLLYRIEYAMAVFLLGLAAGVVYTPNPVEGLLRFSFWLAAFVLCCSTAWAYQHDRNNPLLVAWATSVSCCSFSLHYWWQYVIEYHHSPYATVATGDKALTFFSPIGHINFTADVLIVLLPIVAWLLHAFRHPVLRLFNSISLLSMVFILFSGASRGALGGLAVALLTVLCIVFRHVKFDYFTVFSWRKWLAGLAIIFFILASFQYLPATVRQPERVLNVLPHIFSSPSTPLRKDTSQPPLATFWWQTMPLIGLRAAIYASTSAMIADAPWIGHGTGSFPYVFPAYSNQFPQFRDSLSTMSNMADNPHNLFFQIASQNGIPLAVLFIGILFTLWWRISYTLWKKPSGIMVAGYVAVTAAVFDSMFNHVFFNPASLFVFALFAGIWWASAGSGKKNTTPSNTLRPQKTIAVTTLLVGLCLLFWAVRWGASEWYVGQTLLSQNTESIEDSYQKAYDLNPYNPRAVLGVAQQAYRHQDYNKSLYLLERFVKINPYDARTLNNLATLQAAAGNNNRAVDLLNRALLVQPDFRLVKENLKKMTSRLRQDSG